MPKPKFKSSLLTKNHVDGMVKAMKQAGLNVVRDDSAGTVRAFYGTHEVYAAIEKGHNQPWIVRHVENLFD
jgi:aryl-phospho-beta-D-glucosidase BglC (GH1 family)